MQPSTRVIEDLLRGRRAERAGLFDNIWWDTLAAWVDQGYPKNAEGKPVDPGEHFGFDLCGAGGWFDAMPLRGHSELVEETAEWSVKRNGAGAALKYWKARSGTPEHIDFRMTSREVWERDYRPHLLGLDRQRLKIEDARKSLQRCRERGRWSFYGHLFVWENARQSLGDVCLYESVLLDPDWIHDYNRVYTDFFKAHYRVLIEEAGKPDGVWMYEDLGYKGGLFCSPQVFAELYFPYFRELVEFFHSYDLPVVLHSCGNITAALPMIVEAGFDALNPMERKAGCDPLAMAEQYGDRLAFIGGMDAQVLESGDKALIRREVTDLVEGMKARGARYVFGSDHSVSTNVRYQDFQYAVEVYREHMNY